MRYMMTYPTNLISLSNSVSACLSLQVILGIPVWVKNDHSISCSKIDTQATSTSRQQETEVLELENNETNISTIFWPIIISNVANLVALSNLSNSYFNFALLLLLSSSSSSSLYCGISGLQG